MDTQTTLASNVRLWLHERLAEKRSRNPAFSLRAYARSLGVSPATLSQIMNGKRQLSLETALKIAEREHLSPDERQQLLKNLINGRAGAVKGSCG